MRGKNRVARETEASSEKGARRELERVERQAPSPGVRSPKVGSTTASYLYEDRGVERLGRAKFGFKTVPAVRQPRPDLVTRVADYQYGFSLSTGFRFHLATIGF